MKIFDPIILETRTFLASLNQRGSCREYKAGKPSWPEAGPSDIVLLPDLALELGHPEDASLCFSLWTATNSLVRDETITLVGPDIGETQALRLPFGKIVLATMADFDEETSYERYRRMDLARFELSLKGYMLRAASQYMREWSRISRNAVNNGFSFRVLGSALIHALKSVDGVTAVEVVFITSSPGDVLALRETGMKAAHLIQAMNKMMTEMAEDCGVCEYQDVCADATEMKALRETLARRQNGGDERKRKGSS